MTHCRSSELKTALIILAHGSRLDEANNAVLNLVERMQNDVSPNENITITTAFLQFGKPSLEDSMKNLAEGGNEKILIVPLFLTPGVHITEDIPDILTKSAEIFPMVSFEQCQPLGCDEKLIPILWERIHEHWKP